MKLREIFEDYGDSGKRLSDEQFELAFNAVKRELMDLSEINEVAKEFEENDKFRRTAGSAIFLLTRMHILIHGYAPHGITERSAEQMFIPSKPMEDFVERLGYDVDLNIEQAREELRNRPKKIKRPEAKKAMFDYYKANRSSLPKNIGDQREAIISSIMGGVLPQEAFAQFA